MLFPAASKEAIAGDADAGYRNVVFGYELVCALVVTEIPDHEYTSAVGTNELALVGMYDNVVDRVIMSVVSLNEARSCVPYSYSAVF